MERSTGTPTESGSGNPVAEGTPDAPVVIEAVELTKRYEDGRLALDAVNLQVHAGEIYCLLGANGAGKTTLLNLFLNFIQPTTGQAKILGTVVETDPEKALVQAGFVSDNVQLYNDFSARWNLSFFAKLSGRRNLDSRACDRVLREVGLPEHAFDRAVGTFSRGQRQKLGLAVAMLKDVPALFLDEPLSGLDPKAAFDLVETLKTLRRAGKAIVLSTHDVFRARELGDRVGIFQEGRKVLERTGSQLEEEDLERLYLNFLYDGDGFQPSPGKPSSP